MDKASNVINCLVISGRDGSTPSFPTIFKGVSMFGNEKTYYDIATESKTALGLIAIQIVKTIEELSKSTLENNPNKETISKLLQELCWITGKCGSY